MDGNAPANGTYDFRVELYDAPSGGNQVGLTLTKSAVAVNEGLFTLTLDFGNVFDGLALWLDIAVRPAGSGNFTALQPRQAITATPYALNLIPGSTIKSANYQYTFSASNLKADGTGLYGFSSNKTGVLGRIGASSGYIAPASGVWGDADRSDGVVGSSSHPSGSGVKGISIATSGASYGVYGLSESDSGHGVYGENSVYNSEGFLGGVIPAGFLQYGVGVFGQANGTSGVNYGVFGSTESPSGYGGYFRNDSTNGVALFAHGNGAARSKATLRVENSEPNGGISTYMTNSSTFSTAHFANSGSGQVLYLQNGGTGDAGTAGGNFIEARNTNESDLQFRVASDGTAYSDTSFSGGGADFAEMLPAVDDLEPGDVLVIGGDGKLTRSTNANQLSVVGVYSSKPGFIGGAGPESDLRGKIPLAVLGVVPAKVSTENGPILPGDLLVTSTTPGHAMKSDPNPSVGSVIGKALENLESGLGVINILVILQ